MANGVNGQNPAIGGIAAGTIPCGCFVKADSTEGQWLVAGAGERMHGISFRNARRSSYVDSTDPVPHALIGEPMGLYLPGARCKLKVGTAVTNGQRIKSGALGVAVPATANLEQYGAIALEDGAAGEFIDVIVTFGEVSV